MLCKLVIIIVFELFRKCTCVLITLPAVSRWELLTLLCSNRIPDNFNGIQGSRIGAIPLREKKCNVLGMNIILQIITACPPSRPVSVQFSLKHGEYGLRVREVFPVLDLIDVSRCGISIIPFCERQDTASFFLYRFFMILLLM